jgi:hypothetical protein
LFDVASRDDWDSLVRLRAELSREVPIVALSGCVSKDGTYRKHARALGGAAFVAKPATVEMTVQALQGAASGSPWSEYVGGAST